MKIFESLAVIAVRLVLGVSAILALPVLLIVIVRHV